MMNCWLALPVGNEGPRNLYIGILGMKLPGIPYESGQPENLQQNLRKRRFQTSFLPGFLGETGFESKNIEKPMKVPDGEVDFQFGGWIPNVFIGLSDHNCRAKVNQTSI